MVVLLALLALFWPLFVVSAAGSSEWLELRHGIGREAHRQRLSTPRHGPPCHPITEQPALQLKPPFTSQLMQTLRARSPLVKAFIAPNLLLLDAQTPEELSIGYELVHEGLCHSVVCIAAAPVQRPKYFKTLNRYARFATQSGKHERLPLSNIGLNGEGQYVAVADTGVDFDMCYFHDDKFHVPMNKLELRHRKIVSYTVLSGESMSSDTRHGTHTAASIAGEVQTDDDDTRSFMANYNGMAPGAKLAIFDMTTNTGSGQAELKIPDDLYENLFRKIYYDTPARISSNSWGAEINDVRDAAYDQYALAVDRFTYEHQDFLTLFGAGNWGISMDRRYQTIGTPALAKNTLTVGSCTSFAQSFEEGGKALGVAVEVTVPATVQGVSGMNEFIEADFGPELISLDSKSRYFVLADPPSGCEPIRNRRDADQAIMLVLLEESELCSAAERALNVQAAGAAVCAIINDHDAFDTISDSSHVAANISIPTIGFGKEFGLKLLELLNTTSVVVTAPAYDQQRQMKHSFGFMSDFSSRGPTIDGRLKPDILGPGELITSAKSDNNINSFQCKREFKTMQGTSMATPIVAGNLAQVRQYFSEGWYPSGTKVAIDAIASPSAALLKATVINSGVAVGGQVLSTNAVGIKHYFEVDAPPSNVQGYGRLQLDRVLRFADSAPPDGEFSLHVVYNRTLSSLELSHLCLNATSFRRRLKVTLVWSDYPADVSAEYLLVNNLDLMVVEMSSGAHWFGNIKTPLAADTPDLHIFVDDSNNVEQVEVLKGSPGLYGVHLMGTTVVEGPQPYALVITGDFEVVDVNLCTGHVVCPTNCSDQGTCSEGICNCFDGFAGVDCSYSSEALLARGSAVGDVSVGNWAYFHFDVNDTVPLTLSLKRSSESGDPDLFLSHETMPQLGASQWSNMSRSPTTAIRVEQKQVKSGRYYIGVHAACCDDVRFEISLLRGVHLEDSDAGVNLNIEGSSTVWVVAILCLALSLVLALGTFVLRDISGVNQYRYEQVERQSLEEANSRHRLYN